MSSEQDKQDVRNAEKAIKDMQRKGEKAVPLDKVLRDLKIKK